ncbi:hypothetical protein ACFXOW_23795 [Bacillus subtilis]
MSNSRKKTVAFYEIVRSKEAGDIRIPYQIDWPAVLKNLEDIDPTERRYRNGDDVFYAEPIMAEEGHHLALARLRDGELHEIDWAKGIGRLNLANNKSVADTSIFCFLPFGNIIGVLQGSVSAPRPTAFQRWLNGNNQTGISEELAVMPLIGKNAWEKLKKAEAVNLFEMRLRPGPLILPGETEGLASFSREAHKANPDALVTLTIKIPRGRGYRDSLRSRAERRLRNDVEGFLSQHGGLIGPDGSVDRAIAHVILSSSDGELEEDKINFVSNHITAKKNVTLRRSRGNAPWYEAAVRAVLQASADREQALRDAVSALP